MDRPDIPLYWRHDATPQSRDFRSRPHPPRRGRRRAGLRRQEGRRGIRRGVPQAQPPRRTCPGAEPGALRTGPYEVALAAARLAQHQDMSVEAVELEEHRAGFLDALLGDEGLRAFDLGAADEGANENPGFEAWRHGASIEEYPGGPCLMDQAARNGMILASFTATRSPFSATAAKGSRMRTVVPSPSTDSSVASPPCRVLSALTSARPRPVPSLARTCSPSTCSKGLPSLSRSLAEMPTPESATEISMPRSSRTALRRTS